MNVTITGVSRFMRYLWAPALRTQPPKEKGTNMHRHIGNIHSVSRFMRFM